MAGCLSRGQRMPSTKTSFDRCGGSSQHFFFLFALGTISGRLWSRWMAGRTGLFFFLSRLESIQINQSNLSHRWYIDGILYCDRDYWYSRPGPGEADYPFPAPFDTGFYLIMNVAVGGSFTGGLIDEVSNWLCFVSVRADLRIRCMYKRLNLLYFVYE